MELPAEQTLRWILTRYASFRAAHGAAVGEPALVLPTEEFFPDRIQLDGAGLDALVARLLHHAPVRAEVVARVAVESPEDDPKGGSSGGSGCCGGGCSIDPSAFARAPEDGGAPLAGYALTVPSAVVGDPALLTASLSRAVGGLVLAEAGEDVTRGEEGPLAELIAVASGFGLLLLNGSCVYRKGCGGLKAQRATLLSTSDLAVALALFVRLHGVAPRRARAFMETTQREAFQEALAWVDSNRSLVNRLSVAPETLEGGAFPLGPPAGFLARLFGGDTDLRDDGDLERAPQRPAKPPRARTPEEARRLAETKALVEEVLPRR